MDESLLGWIFLIAMFAWRWKSDDSNVQEKLHSWGKIGVLLQWYVITFLGLLYLLLRTLYDIFIYDIKAYDWLRSPRILENLANIKEDNPGVTEEDIEALVMPNGLRCLSLAAPAFGLAAFVVISVQVMLLVKFNIQHRSSLKFQLTAKIEMVLLILGIPMVFVVMSLRSLIRVWTVMTGSAWLHYHTHPAEGVTWDTVETLELQTYTMDLELAKAVQFYSIWTFGQLCGSILSEFQLLRYSTQELPAEALDDYRKTLKWLALQGVYAFALVGIVRSVFDIAIALMQESKMDVVADKVADTALAKVATIFIFVTILCVLNMTFLNKLKPITQTLGNANLKFTGARLLLLITQMQPQILQSVTLGSDLYVTIHSKAKDFGIEPYLQMWTFNAYQAKLLDVSLLCVECLVVAIFNFVAWQLDLGKMEALVEAGDDNTYQRMP